MYGCVNKRVDIVAVAWLHGCVDIYFCSDYFGGVCIPSRVTASKYRGVVVPN